MFKKESAIASGKIDTLIGAGTSLEGKIQAHGVLRVEGRIRGEVVSEGDIIVGEKGEIRAHIKARHVTIAGKVFGNIQASGRMHLLASGSLQGDVDAGTIAVEEGAHFKGTCRMAESSTGKKRPVEAGEPQDPQPSEADPMKESVRPLTDAPQW